MASKSEKGNQVEESSEDSLNISELVEILEGDVTSLEPEAAIAVIDEWEAVLKGSKDAGLKEIDSSLKQLKKLLKGSKTQAADLSEVLVQLGHQTTEAAAEAERGTKGQLQKVGKSLSKIGKSLEDAESDSEESDSKPAKAKKESDDEPEAAEGSDLHELLEALEGDVTSLEPEAAIEVIDEWHDALKGSKDEGLKAINHGLTELKKQLKRSKPDGAKLGELLVELGEQTEAAADAAERGTKGQLQKVGKALSKIGKSLAE